MRSDAAASWLSPDWPAGTPARALMTTRQGGCSRAPFESLNLRDGLGDDAVAVAANRAVFEAALGGARPVLLDQVHGCTVVRLHAADAAPGAPRPRADASITTENGLACCVQVADCLPLLFVAPGGVGAAHAGWRGLSAGVVEATLAALCTACDCRPADVRVWLGACIGPRQFEVGADVLHAFGIEPGAGHSPHAVPYRPGKWLADLPGLARERLLRAGVRAVSGGNWCTVEDASRFFSFRRDGVTGRMAAAVWRA